MVKFKLISVVYCSSLLLVAATISCSGGMPSSPRPPEPPSHQEQPSPPPAGALTGSPSYCRALVSLEQANQLSRFVVDTYNKKMSHLPGFARAKMNTNGEQPVVTFANPQKPSLYFPKKSTPFHTTLCSNPTSPYFKCADSFLLSTIAANASSRDPVSEYVRYYKTKTTPRDYGFDAPREFGPIFIALPINPGELVEANNRVVSGVLHVSIAKVWTSDPAHPESARAVNLRKQFVNDLAEEFSNFRANLPNRISFDSVTCLP
jgi:hypothetical protein